MKKKKWIKKVVILCVVIIIIELIAMLIMKIVRERNIDHFDNLNDVILVDDGYVGVGESDFDNSKFVSKKYYQHTDTITKTKERILANQAKIAKYDKDMNIIWESTIDNKYDSTFYSVIKVNDGYLAVGSYVEEYQQIDANTRNAILVKYDLNGKILWYKDYSVLSDTEFYKIIDDGNDNYVIIGQSIYENMEMGTHTTGGGIIVRYDKEGNLLAHNNYGGNKSGSFNDIIKVDDGYIVCGKDAVNYGIVIKFKKDFNREESDSGLITKKIIWNRTYSNTDEVGFTGMVLHDNTLYTIGAVNVSKDKDKDDKPIYKYDAGIVLYNTNGKYLGKYSLEEEVHHRFNSVIQSGEELILTGLNDVDNKNEKKGSMIIKYNLSDNKFSDKKIKDNYYISKIMKLNNKLLIIGNSNNDCNLLGCEYQSIIEEYK